jgi:hypothetical protein
MAMGKLQPDFFSPLASTQSTQPTLCIVVWGQVIFNMTSSVDAKLLRQTKFPPEFNQKVDMKKVNVEVMKKYGIPSEPFERVLTWVWYRWIAGKISDILGSEDDVVIELCFNLLEGSRFVSLPVRFTLEP